MTAARRAGLLAAATVIVWLCTGAAVSAEPDRTGVLVIDVPGLSFERLLSLPEVAALARAGGAALLVDTGDRSDHYSAYPEIEPGASPIVVRDMDPVRLGGLDRVGELIREEVSASPESDLLVIVLSTTASTAMRAAKDDVHPIVLARGAPEALFEASGSPGTLTSDSTHRIGIVGDGDLWPTIAVSRGRDVPRDAIGSAIRVVEGPVPFDLHERYLAMRRMTVPVGTAAGLYVTLGGLFALGVVLAASRRHASRPLGWIASGIALSVPVLAASLLAAGHLPTLSYATVVAFVVGVSAVVTVVALVLARNEILRGPVVIAAAVLAFVFAEAALGWTAALTPLLGGSHLDGARFYGMPNVEIGLVLGASLWLAAVVPTWWGFTLLVGVALFAGLPFAGANLGGAVTLFAAAGIWPGIRRGRPGWRDVALAFAVTAIGVVVIVLANRVLSTTPTHIADAGKDGVAALWPTFVDRLAIGWRLIERNPFAIVPVAGVLATLLAVIRPPDSIAASLDRRPAWRAGLVTILLACIVAYLANDTGPAAVGVGFGMALGGLLYVSSADRTWKMEPA